LHTFKKAGKKLFNVLGASLYLEYLLCTSVFKVIEKRKIYEKYIQFGQISAIGKQSKVRSFSNLGLILKDTIVFAEVGI
jgi:hypothetical protein